MEQASTPSSLSLALRFAPAVVVSVAVAEVAFKFGSFALEFVAWAATFWALLQVQGLLERAFRRAG